MSGTKLALAVAGGIVIGGVVLCGVGAALMAPRSHPSAQVDDRTKDRKYALSGATMIGLSLLMWATDHDDYLPAKATFRADIAPLLIKKTQTPALRKELESELQRFDYRAKTQKVTDTKDPSAEVLGAIKGEGGEAVVYYNGKAQWEYAD